MALALYRKYRPRTFAEVIGQEHVTEPLMQALRTGRLNHAYLFSGPRGCGKTSSARILARSLNCEKGPTPEPCGDCDSCVALAPDGPGSLDVIEIDAASHGGVDDARDLRERAFFAPVSSRFKVYIIDEAHMISSQGFNALLKLVEEPPEYIKFVFATTEPEKVLGTIRSRTHHYPFRLIPPGVLRPYLEQLCVREGVSVEPAVFPLIVRAGGGSARDSLSVLDQLIAGAGTGGVPYSQAVTLLGVTDAALIDEVCDALAAGDGAAVFATIDRVAEAGHDPRRFAGDLLERLRDLIVLQQVPDAAKKGLLDAPADDLGRMEAQASRFGPATLSRMADIVHTGLTEMRGTTAPRLLLELVCARMLLPGADDSAAALLQRLERMERRLTATNDTAPLNSPVQPASSPAQPASSPAQPASSPAQPASSPAQPANSRSASPPVQPANSPVQPVSPSASAGAVLAAEPGPRHAEVAAPAGPPVVEAVQPQTSEPAASGPSPAAPPLAGPPAATASGAAGVVDAAAVRRVWEEILGYLRRRSQRAAAVVREAVVREVEGDTLILSFRHQFHADSLTAAPELLQEAVYEVLGGRWRIRAEWAGGGNPSPGPAESAGQRSTRPGTAGPVAGSDASEPAPVGRGSSAASSPAPGSAAQPAQVPASQPAQVPASQPASAQKPAGQPAPAQVPAGPPAAGHGRVSQPRSAEGSGGQPISGQPAPGQESGFGQPGSGRGSGGQPVPPQDQPSPQGQPSRSGSARAVASTGVAGDSRSGSAQAAASTAAAGVAVVEEDWPETALPGGILAPEPAVQVAAPAAPARTPGRAAAARAESAARGAGRSGSGRGGPGRSGAGTRRAASGDGTWPDAPPADEPPFDPDYDRPVPDQYDGFDPGDEPLDDADPSAVRESSEEQALRLLRETLGAETIS